MNRKLFRELLESNQSVKIIFFTGKGCVPCKNVERLVIPKINEGFPVIRLDREIDSDLYSALRSSKQLRGVPTLMAYKKGNTSLIPDWCVSGYNPAGIEEFFIQCSEEIC